MLTLIRNAHVFSPHPLGVCDVLIAGNRIAQVEASIDLAGQGVEVLDAGGRWLLPGFVDSLTHPSGGGGEGGFGNRTRELKAEDFINAGVTSPVGALGTDSITRSLETLYGQVMKLRAGGLAAYMFSGSYRVPADTLTGDVARDLVLIEPVIGVGEVAIADHRSSQLSAQELRRLAADVHLGGTLSGKGGTLLIHVGDGPAGLDLIESALAGSDLPRRLFFPTHCNRRKGLLDQAIAHARQGGYMDLTVSTTPELIEAGELPALEAHRSALEAGAPFGRLTFSSDAGGSLPLYRDGELVGLTTAAPASLLDLLRTASAGRSQPPAKVLAALTCNPADALKLPKKGRIASGADADLLLVDPAAAQLNEVFCLGRRLLRHGRIDIQKNEHMH
jgi:beta-aspartyl-dipeptidase (metallo-type)